MNDTATKTEYSSALDILSAAFRHNTGAYGRHHEKPPIPNGGVSIEVYRQRDGSWDVNAIMETAHFLAGRSEWLSEMQSEFDSWAAKDENSELSWLEAGSAFMEQLNSEDEAPEGWQLLARDDVYNRENDVSQVYVWEVWAPAHLDVSDWIYCEDAIFVVYAHTGCDVRGGYSFPVFLKSESDYSVPLDLVAQFGINEARLDGEQIDREECQALDEEWQCGYSSHPSSEFSDNLERVFFADKTAPLGYLLCKLKSGEVCKVFASMPYV